LDGFIDLVRNTEANIALGLASSPIFTVGPRQPKSEDAEQTSCCSHVPARGGFAIDSTLDASMPNMARSKRIHLAQQRKDKSGCYTLQATPRAVLLGRAATPPDAVKWLAIEDLVHA
jgi:hypothetical protein